MTKIRSLRAGIVFLLMVSICSLANLQPIAAVEVSPERAMFDVMSSPDGIVVRHLIESAYADPEFFRFITAATESQIPVAGADLGPLMASTPAESLVGLIEGSAVEVTTHTLPDYSQHIVAKLNSITQNPSYEQVVEDVSALLRRGDIASLINANDAIRNSPLLRPGTRGISNFTAAVITAVGAGVIFVGSAIACVPLALACAVIAVGSIIVFTGAVVYAFNEANSAAGYEFQIDNISCVGNDCSAGGLATGPSPVSGVSGFCELKVTDGSIYSSTSGACDSTQFFYTTTSPVYNGRAGVNERDHSGCYKTFTAEFYVYWSNNTYSRDEKTVAKTTTASCF